MKDSNIEKHNMTILFLSIVASFLLVSLLVGILIRKNSLKIESQESALLNPKYIDEVYDIQIIMPFYGNSSVPIKPNEVTLQRQGSIWIGSTDSTNGQLWPVSKNEVENLLKTITNVVKMYKKSDSSKSWRSLSVTQDTARTIVFKGKDGGYISELYFGVENPLANRISVRSSSKQSVYEVDDSILYFLTSESSFWCDPYVYPQYVTGLSDSESSSIIRHGNIISFDDVSRKKPIEIFKKNFGNGAAVSLKIFKGQEESYSVIPEFEPSLLSTSIEKSAIKSLRYSYSISSWTYKKLVENEK